MAGLVRVTLALGQPCWRTSWCGHSVVAVEYRSFEFGQQKAECSLNYDQNDSIFHATGSGAIAAAHILDIHPAF